ncbi:hypothetical protein [Streptomyces sp. E5N91]|uniref:hypothetical protein n=1 Tax=Streptomyces sp. E5N91 TaxID=1851996 RepID=UPI001EE8DD0E|nr:hypothetical protein [Streptomyces sp. E5N91]
MSTAWRGTALPTEEYEVLAKGLGLQYVLRGRFSDLYVHDTVATGFGCDFLQDTVVEGCWPSGAGGRTPARRWVARASGSGSAGGGRSSGWR